MNFILFNVARRDIFMDFAPMNIFLSLRKYMPK